MSKKGLSKILVGICLVLVLALALPLTSACAPAEETPTPTPSPTPTPGPSPTPTPGPSPTPAWQPPDKVPCILPSTAGSGYPSGAALLATLEEASGVEFPFSPAAKTMGRTVALKQGQVDFAWYTAADCIFAMEGIAGACYIAYNARPIMSGCRL